MRLAILQKFSCKLWQRSNLLNISSMDDSQYAVSIELTELKQLQIDCVVYIVVVLYAISNKLTVHYLKTRCS